MAKKTVYREGDRVIIKNPVEVVRVGYPLGMDNIDLPQEAEEDMQQTLAKLLGIAPSKTHKSYRKIVSEMKYLLLRQKCFGGSTRSLHTKIREELQGVTGRVVGKRRVVTGVYHPGLQSRSWYDDDSEPASLGKEVHHILLNISISVKSGDPHEKDIYGYSVYKTEDIWIEEKDVEEIYIRPYVRSKRKVSK